MKVYIVLYNDPHDASFIVGVSSTSEGAYTIRDEHQRQNDLYDWYEIESHEVQE